MVKRRTGLVVIVIVLMLFVAMTYTTMTSNTVIPDKGDEDPRLTFADKLTNYAENNTIPNPIIPMIFHYLDRYFNDLVEDDVDDIFKRVLDLAPDDAITMLRNGLGNYTTHKHLLESIIPAQYYTLDVADTIDMLGESGFINLTLDFAQESDIAFAEGGTVYHEFENPGEIRWLNGSLAEYSLIPFEENITEPYIHHLSYTNALTSLRRTASAIHIKTPEEPAITQQQRDDAPVIRPGTDVTLYGANFYNTELRVNIWSDLELSDMTKVANLPGWVKGDLVTPVNNLEWNWDDVEDTITFQIPKLSPGYYAISVYEGPLSGSGIVPLETEWRNTRYRVLFNVPPPRDEEYVIFLTEIRCVDETNPESILGVNAQDEIFAYFAAVTGDQDPWQVEVFHEENYHDVLTPAGILTLQRPLEFDDDTTRYINEIKDGWLFGSERSISPVDGVVAIANMLIESDQGEADIAKYIADALLDIGEYVANSFLPIAGWVISFIKFVLREIIFAIIDWLAADVTVGQDLIVFTEDELYYLTAETNRMLIANSPHYFPGTVTTDSGIDIWIGNHYNEAKSFWEWRCYGNNDEPSEYWIKLEVIRVP